MAASIILVPGWPHAEGSLAALHQEMDRGTPTRTLDLFTLETTGQGEPLGPESPLSNYARGLIRLIGDATILVGWSMGGMVGLEAAAAIPNRLRALILVSTTPRFCAGDGFRHGFSEDALLTLRAEIAAEPAAALNRFLELSGGAGAAGTGATGTGARNEGFPPHLHRKPEGLLRGLDYLRHTDLRQLCARVPVPTLVLHGRRDTVIPWRAGKWLSEALPRSEITVFPEEPHNLPLRSPAAVAGRIREFLAGI